jgi:hypothetical protein
MTLAPPNLADVTEREWSLTVYELLDMLGGGR